MMMRLNSALHSHGLLLAGAVHRDEKTVYLIAPDTRRFWNIFTSSPEDQDGQRDPIDRWSKRVIGDLASQVGASAAFPFGGPPWQPFLTWAVESGHAWSSPIGPLVHSQMGLWLSFRGAIIVDELDDLRTPAARPCDTCTAPCETACPVSAFASGVYDVQACRAHVRSDAGIACRSGCLARHACPVGRDFTPPPAQAAHHMKYFT